MTRSGWLVAAFIVTSFALISFDSSATGQPPKTDPKKTDPKKSPEQKKAPEAPRKAPEPQPTPPPVGPSELDGPTVDTTKPTSPIDLIRGLRESDGTDLALEYIAILEKKPLAPDVKMVLPLEAALTRLEAAKDESDAVKRDALIERAKGEFEQFGKANSSHPRAIEAAVALARATSFQARGQLSRALKQPKDGDKDKSAALKVQPLFDDASKRFTTAAGKLADLVNGGSLSGSQKTLMTRELNQAQLESGINLYEKSRTYVRPSGPKEVTPRSDALKEAKKAFKVVGDRDPNNPYSWIAKAWGIECDYALQQVGDADKQVLALRNDANRYPAAKEGVRMLRYFEMARKYGDARTPAELVAARGLGERWLADYRTPKGSREQFAVQYYIATLRKEEAMAGVKTSKQADGTTKIESVSPGAVSTFRIVDRELRRLIETENEYSERAATDRTSVIRLIIGDKLKPASEYKTFEESQMAALVELSSALRDEKVTPEDRSKKMASAAGYLQQAIRLATPQDSAKDLLDARIQLTYAFLQGGQPQQAAVLGEYLARTARTPAEAARAGAIAVQAYLSSAPAADTADDDYRQSATVIDRGRALALATSLETKFPGETSTDSIRSMMGGQLYRTGQYYEAFQVLSRITPQFGGLNGARLMEGAAAYQTLRPDPKSSLSAKDKKAVFDKAIADLNAITEPTLAASMADVRSYLRCRQQLVELYLLDPQSSLQKAVTTAAEIELKAVKFKNLPPLAQQIHAFDAERLRLTALASQATPLFNTASWAELSNLLDPHLADLAKRVSTNGTAVAQAAKAKSDEEPELSGELAGAAERLDQFRRERIVLLSLQAKIRAGETDKTSDLIDLVEKLGGSLDANAATLSQLLGTVKTQAATLKKQQKGDEADKLMQAVGELFVKFAAKKDLPTKYSYFAGKSLNDLGQANKALDLLAKLPDAPGEDLKAKFNDLPDDKKNAVRTHRSAKLELAKAYRLTNQFAEADGVLKAAMGDDKNPGWAAKVLDYRREAILLLEAKAAAAEGKTMNEQWAIANQAWGKLAREYGAVLTQPLPKDEEKKNELIRNREQIKPIYFGLFADNQRCLIKANQMILKGKPELLDKRYDSIANAIKSVEDQNKDLPAAVRERFADLLDETPDLKKKYASAKGTMFLRDANGQLPNSETN